ncbi:MAG TPA: cytochrome-c peroxidase [Microscillaceae bacterium]|jgi:cytochrome c peroxidase|nr:cytochrome-c peroxidase [Microscillaceae bacterium]
MNKPSAIHYVLCLLFVAFITPACTSKKDTKPQYQAVARTFGVNLDLNNLENYTQAPPNYIRKDNAANNPVTNKGATLGRVLFYDKQLSIDNTIACASCHQQANAFTDPAQVSAGVSGGITGRHSMRLVNARFGDDPRFFWDERARTLEIQTTQPIQDHAEMGFSGQNGRPNLQNLITKLQAIDYYQELFTFVYGDAQITEERIQLALAQFVRSIQSFDARYDVGRAQVANDNAPFPNFTALENQGKNLFISPPQFNLNGVRTGGGAGCGGCHRAPEFDIAPNGQNNGFISKIGGGTDLTVVRSPTLRDLVKANGAMNGKFMHTGFSDQLSAVVEHYNLISTVGNNNLDPRLRPNGQGQNLQLTQNEKDALVAFMRTLSGTDVYTNKKWSNPFL